MKYIVCSKYSNYGDKDHKVKDSNKEFETFAEAKKFFNGELSDWGSYFVQEKVSGVFYKFYFDTMRNYGRRYWYAGCLYLKKVA